MERVEISILGRDYTLACPPAEKDNLLAAIAHVERSIAKIQETGRVSGNDRIAVMAALQIATELLAMRAPDGPLGGVAIGDFKRKIDHMNTLIDEALPSTTL
ncbi:MAG TPA: cell division protein ZapA [Candidatus Paenalcaligenes intestinipullorum]|uniref:Cell division protein ZapA n=1 Tax=Candidatus Paenalcaligenes intestinipullorum TaxID=2838718 RepID=A0A9D2RJ59_9BURK|nr:cell division protein ZapA [Candidatus Paenalcaligenes intestinipullorum]